MWCSVVWFGVVLCGVVWCSRNKNSKHRRRRRFTLEAQIRRTLPRLSTPITWFLLCSCCGAAADAGFKNATTLLLAFAASGCVRFSDERDTDCFAATLTKSNTATNARRVLAWPPNGPHSPAGISRASATQTHKVEHIHKGQVGTILAIPTVHIHQRA